MHAQHPDCSQIRFGMRLAVGAIVTSYDHVEAGQQVARRVDQSQMIAPSTCDDGQFHNPVQLCQGLPDERP